MTLPNQRIKRNTQAQESARLRRIADRIFPRWDCIRCQHGEALATARNFVNTDKGAVVVYDGHKLGSTWLDTEIYRVRVVARHSARATTCAAAGV